MLTGPGNPSLKWFTNEEGYLHWIQIIDLACARAMTVSPQGNQRHWHTSGSRPQGSSYAGPDLGLISQQDPAVGEFCAPVVSRVCDLLLSGCADHRKGEAVPGVGAECEQAVF